MRLLDKWLLLFLAAIFCNIFHLVRCKTNKPNIIMIVADDLGWNDVGFHGFSQIPTPNIDALAYHGMILNRHYVLPTCTPSRASLMTGKYAIRTGLQGDPGNAASPWALPIEEKILPQYLKELGYQTHLVGKWHLGFCQRKFTPTERGFDSFFGYYNGWVRYNDSVSISLGQQTLSGYDARRNFKPAADETDGKYLTNVFTEEAIKIIKNHNQESPLFLDISHVAVHAVINDILQVANETENNIKFHYIQDEHRRLFAGMLDNLDQSVGRVIRALDEEELLENSIIIFMADNGGPTKDPLYTFANTASNWPLRGMKTSFFDGAVRGAMAIWSPLLKHKNTVSHELFHISDWLPTFVAAGGGEINHHWDLDGVNQWPYLTGLQLRSSRKEVLVNIDQNKGIYGIIFQKWKLLHCNESYVPSFADHYEGIPGREDSEISYSIDSVLQSLTSQTLVKYSPPILHIREKFNQTRKSAMIDAACQKRINAGRIPHVKQCHGDLLFDVEADPCEFHDIETSSVPAVVQFLKARLAYFESQTQIIQDYPTDPLANPKLHSGYWSSWLDTDEEQNYGVMAVSSGLLIVFSIIIFKIG